MRNIPLIGKPITIKKEIIPFFDQVLMEELPTNNTSTGGIIIPEAHVTKVNQGRVVDKGPLASATIKNGDILFFPLHSEARLVLADRKFILCSESQCLGAIREIK